MDADADIAANAVFPTSLPTILTGGLIAGIAGAPTIQYRLEFGSFSMALMEIIGLASAGGLWWLAQREPGGWKARIKAATADPLTRFVLGMVAALLAWSAAIGLWAAASAGAPAGGWRAWAADMRNWVIPSLIFWTLVLMVHTGWRRWTLLFVAFGLAQALLGAYQWATNSFRPLATSNAFYKAEFTLDPATKRPQPASFGLGLFGHPNDLALYLVLALLIGLGWWLIGRRRLLKGIVLAAMLFGVAITYAKTSIAVAAISCAAVLFHQRIRPNRSFATAAGATLIAAGGAAWLAASLLPRLALGTLSWRAQLWDSAGGLALREPGILAVGGGLDDFAEVAIYPQPHNLILYLALAYGLFGAIWLGLLIWRLHTAAWRMRRTGGLHREPLLAALWLGLWAFMAVGALESPLISIEWRMIMLLIVGCFICLHREILRESYATV